MILVLLLLLTLGTHGWSFPRQGGGDGDGRYPTGDPSSSSFFWIDQAQREREVLLVSSKNSMLKGEDGNLPNNATRMGASLWPPSLQPDSNNNRTVIGSNSNLFRIASSGVELIKEFRHHLPPASIPLLLWWATHRSSSKALAPLAGWMFGLAGISFLHAQFQATHRLTPLFLADNNYKDLPPFLPLIPTDPLDDAGSMLWQRRRLDQKHQRAVLRRQAIVQELLDRQEQKQASKKKKKRDRSNSKDIQDQLPQANYALVTGASQGIGRAMAVELARWEIPLVLVARNLGRLQALATELQALYGISCVVLPADLSQPDAAEHVYQATKQAGLTIDLLINNAGMGFEGDGVDMPMEKLQDMVILNTLTYAKMARLFGHDMKRRRRGRILMVASLAGWTVSSPNTAVYGATKAFGKTLGLSLAKELEPYGVGVTCLAPGPVVDTEFKAASQTDRAVCWSVPFLPRPAHQVAHQGISALLRGDSRVVVMPGWINQVFAYVCIPILPLRLQTMAVHQAWSPPPFELPFLNRSNGARQNDIDNSMEYTVDPRFQKLPPPTILHIEPSRPEEKPSAVEEEKQEIESEKTVTSLAQEGVEKIIKQKDAAKEPEKETPPGPNQESTPAPTDEDEQDTSEADLSKWPRLPDLWDNKNEFDLLEEDWGYSRMLWEGQLSQEAEDNSSK